MSISRPPRPEKDPRRVREMFAAIAGGYDRLNRVLTFGQDRAWRREALNRLGAGTGDVVLDVGAGTGDLAIELASLGTGCRVIACDFTAEMLALGRAREGARSVDWVLADAQKLPFSPATFDRVVSGFLLRNLADLQGGLVEQARVLKGGGKAVWLDTSPLAPGMLKPLLSVYMERIVPLLGGWLARDRPAYGYLSRTSAGFVPAARLAAHMIAAGFEQVNYVRRMLGVVAIHWGAKTKE
ncbi:MAG: ubiquinone/menaquinone biosynthesis methyltransferase [Anaerolineae bacterium]|nr:ubiquinone/menaquinone biosynthesis methyltransferase [Anaerolineae bacterium]